MELPKIILIIILLYPEVSCSDLNLQMIINFKLFLRDIVLLLKFYSELIAYLLLVLIQYFK